MTNSDRKKKKPMRLLLTLIMIFSFIGCKDQKTEYAFISVDYSYFDGYFRSIKILNNSKTYISYSFNYPS